MGFIKDFLKVTFGWAIGVIIYEFFVSQWQNEAMNWVDIVDFILAGSIGILIGLGFRSSKKNKSKKTGIGVFFLISRSGTRSTSK